MSDPAFPYAVWAANTLQNDIPANDNSLRTEMLIVSALAIESTQPGSPTDGDCYIIGAAPSGAQWSTFTEDDIALYRGGTWYAIEPPAGLLKYNEDDSTVYLFDGGWAVFSGGGGGGGASPVVTESGTNLDADNTNAGNYTRFTNSGTKTYTFDSADSFNVGDEYHGRNVGAGLLTITEAGSFVINAPAGGTMDIPEGGTFTVKIVASAEADLFGLTVLL
jgi:hypothetical protein